MGAAVQQKPEIKIKLSVVKGPHSGQVFQLNKEVITLGRGPENNVVLMNDPQISRNHAQLSVINGELEVSNLSQKNSILVDGANVQKWKIVNGSTFTIGDSEISVEYDLGRAVVSVHKPERSADVLPLKVKVTPPKAEQKTPARQQPVPIRNQASNAAPALRSQPLGRPLQNMTPPLQQMGGPAPAANLDYQQNKPDDNKSLLVNPNFKIFLILVIVAAAAYSVMSTPNKKSQIKKIASTLKYEDEVNNRLNSKKEKELEEDREYLKKQKMSPQSLRVNENFIRGMRDFQLGNYVRAQQFFQLVLNLDPDHPLAKRHLYLAKVRHDELVKEKLMLGDSYYKKHNFKMCESMYIQVMDMLQGKNNDQNFLLAEKKAHECNLASQGIN